jgi:hypothetical protein
MVKLAPSPGDDRTEDERAQIHRLEALCKTTQHWELECSHTDAGDPWCVVYDRDQHRIVLHIARIDRRYVVVWPPGECSTSKPTIAAAIDLALGQLEAT